MKGFCKREVLSHNSIMVQNFSDQQQVTPFSGYQTREKEIHEFATEGERDR